MALTKSATADKIEVISRQKEEESGEVVEVTSVQVRTTIKILEDDAVISQSYHRHVIQSGDDYSSEPANVQAVCSAVFGG